MLLIESNMETKQSSLKTSSEVKFSSVVLEGENTENFNVNRHHNIWKSVYTEIRKLCVVKGERISRYAPDFAGKPRKSITFVHGEVRVNPEFWDTLKPAHKSQLTMLINKIRALYKQLEEIEVASRLEVEVEETVSTALIPYNG